MSNQIKFKRGQKSNLPTLALGEPAFTSDSRELFIGTGGGNINMSGAQWYTGTAMSGTSTTTGANYYSSCPLVKQGDIYLNTSNGNMYQCTTAGVGTSAKWTYRGCLKGADGGAGMVDTRLSDNSTNAVQNKAITAAIAMTGGIMDFLCHGSSLGSEGTLLYIGNSDYQLSPRTGETPASLNGKYAYSGLVDYEMSGASYIDIYDGSTDGYVSVPIVREVYSDDFMNVEYSRNNVSAELGHKYLYRLTVTDTVKRAVIVAEW